MAGPKNAVVGDSYGTDLPKTEVKEDALEGERKKARYSRSAEFQELKDYIEARIAFFKGYLPGGKEVRFSEKDATEGYIHWVVANNIILEFQNILDRYAQAEEAVKFQ